MKIQANHTSATALLTPSVLPTATPTTGDSRLSSYLLAAAGDTQALKQDSLDAIGQDVIPMGESHFDSSLTADILGLADEWPWTITRSPNEIRMFCPGRFNPETGKNEDKQIVLTSENGKVTLKIMIDGDWLPPIQGQLHNGVFQGEGGQTVQIQANRQGFRLELDNVYPDLDGRGIQMERKS